MIGRTDDSDTTGKDIDDERWHGTRYRDIAHDLTTRIASGEFAPGDQLPSIAALMAHYDVPGLNTIRQAQQLLVDDCLLAAAA